MIVSAFMTYIANWDAYELHLGEEKVFNDFMMNATILHFTYDRRGPRHTSWNARLNVLVLTTTFKCSLKAYLTSITLSSPAIVMVLTHARC